MAKKISDLTAGVALVDADLFESVQSVATTPVSRKTSALQIKSYISDQGLFTTDNVTFNSLSTDLIQPNLTTEIEIENSWLTKTGQDPTLQVGRASANTNNACITIQSKRDACIFVEADTDAVATGDVAIEVATMHGNEAMGRIIGNPVTQSFNIDVGRSNTAAFNPDMIFGTGGDYGATPATGTKPDYAGGGKIPPLEALRISGTDQSVLIKKNIKLEDPGAGTNTVTIISPAALAADWTFTLPPNDGDAGQVLTTDGNGVTTWTTNAGGDVTGPASATDNALARFDTTTGKLIQNSSATLDDSGNVIFTGDITCGSDVVTDFISEKTTNHGVDIDALRIKDTTIDTQVGAQLQLGPTNATSISLQQPSIVGGTSINASAELQVDSTTKGFLPPRMSGAERTAILTPATGLMVYDTTDNQWYGYNGSAWVILG